MFNRIIHPVGLLSLALVIALIGCERQGKMRQDYRDVVANEEDDAPPMGMGGGNGFGGNGFGGNKGKGNKGNDRKRPEFGGGNGDNEPNDPNGKKATDNGKEKQDPKPNNNKPDEDSADVGAIKTLFKNAQTAMDKGEWKKFTSLLTPESKVELSGGVVMLYAFSKGILALNPDPNPDTKNQLAKLQQTLEKHGLTKDNLPDQAKLSEFPSTKGEQKAFLKSIVAPVKDHDAFLVDAIPVIEQMTKGKGHKPFTPDTKLENLKVENDRATATLTTIIDEEPRQMPIVFRKIEGNWLIEMQLPHRKHESSGKKKQ